MSQCMHSCFLTGGEAKLPEGDRRKENYAWAECDGPDPFICHEQFDKEIIEAIEWQASRSAEQVMREREEMITKLESANEMMRKTGRGPYGTSPSL